MDIELRFDPELAAFARAHCVGGFAEGLEAKGMRVDTLASGAFHLTFKEGNRDQISLIQLVFLPCLLKDAPESKRILQKLHNADVLYDAEGPA